MSKHTPGSWNVRYTKNMTVISTPKGEFQISLHNAHNGLRPINCNIQEWEANGRLIAEAPETKAQRDELLAALEYIKIYNDKYISENGLTSISHLIDVAATNAIRKAKGE